MPTCSITSDTKQVWRIESGDIHIGLQATVKGEKFAPLMLLYCKTGDYVASLSNTAVPEGFELVLITSTHFSLQETEDKSWFDTLQKNMLSTPVSISIDSEEKADQVMLNAWATYYQQYWLQEKSKREIAIETERHTLERSLHHLASVVKLSQIDSHSSEVTGNFIRACQRALFESGVSIPSHWPSENKLTIFEASNYFDRLRLNYRQVRLSGRWWLEDSGPLLAATKQGEFVVLLLNKKGRYEVYSPESGNTRLVNQQIADQLEVVAWTFYRELADSSSNWWRLIQLGGFKQKKNILSILSIAALSMLFLLFIPYGQQLLVNHVLPNDSHNQLVWLVVFMLTFASVSAICYFCQGLLTLRLIGLLSNSMQAAIWARLLKLPTQFFRRFRSVDLAFRALGVQETPFALSASTISAFLSVPLSILYIALMAIYSWAIAFYALLISSAFLALVFTLAKKMAKSSLEQKNASGLMTSRVLQFLAGLPKIRTSFSEKRVYSDWATGFAKQQSYAYRSLFYDAFLQTASSILPFIATLGLFFLIAREINHIPSINTGNALLLISAFAGLVAALNQAVFSIQIVVPSIPSLQRSTVILNESPEGGTEKGEVLTDVQGAIEGKNLCFSYSNSATWVLNKLDLSVPAGSYIAIVGSSGSGKSTLLRLLLGFEKPSRGTLAYDTRSVANLDMAMFRKNIGVVLQNSQLIMGNILDNITGGLAYPIEEVWEVAELVGVADDIRAMPMGLFTYISDEGNSLSGAERQLILIARALIRKPRILFLDEATSLMDEKSQQRVIDLLRSLSITRVVIAHRLSTVKQVDCIYMLEKGRFTEQGTFDQLIEKQGAFSALVKSQMTD